MEAHQELVDTMSQTSSSIAIVLTVLIVIGVILWAIWKAGQLNK